MKTNTYHLVLQIIGMVMILVSGGCTEGETPSPILPPPSYFILLNDTELEPGNPELENDFSTISFSVKNDILYVSVNNFEKPCGSDMILDGMIVKYDDGNSGGLDILFEDLDKEPESYSYHSLMCRLDIPLYLKGKQKYKCSLGISYYRNSKRILINRALEIGEGETVEWRVEKLCLENVLKQPDEE